MKCGSTRWWLAVVLLVVLGVTFIGMGRWQLSRAEQRREIGRLIEVGRHAAPIALSSVESTDEVLPWQAASASGHWLSQYGVLLDNRSAGTRPGLWLAMPMRLVDGRVLLVLRGWLPRPLDGQGVTANMKASSGVSSIQGELALHVPRLYQLQEDDQLTFDMPPAVHGDESIHLNLMTTPRRQNLSTEDLSQAIGEPVLPFVLMQTSSDDTIDVDGQGLLYAWPEPSVDADKNMGYAVQWFAFAAIAFGALIVLLWRSRRREIISP